MPLHLLQALFELEVALLLLGQLVPGILETELEEIELFLLLDHPGLQELELLHNFGLLAC